MNLLSDRAHPCQALADLLTLREHFGGSKAAASPTSVTATTSPRRSRSAAALSGVELVVASPEGYELDADVVDRARNLGGTIELTGDPTTRCGAPTRLHRRVDVDGAGSRARAAAARVRGLHGRRRADEGARAPTRVFLHCLPAHRGEEVAAEVIDGPAVARVAAGREPHALGARRCSRPPGGSDD